MKYSNAVMVLSSEKARKVLGWKPRFRTSLEVLQRFLQSVPASG